MHIVAWNHHRYIVNFHKKRSVPKEILSEVSVVKMIDITRDNCISCLKLYNTETLHYTDANIFKTLKEEADSKTKWCNVKLQTFHYNTGVAVIHLQENVSVPVTSSVAWHVPRRSTY